MSKENGKPVEPYSMELAEARKKRGECPNDGTKLIVDSGARGHKRKCSKCGWYQVSPTPFVDKEAK